MDRHLAHKRTLADALPAVAAAGAARLDAALGAIVATDAVFHAYHPVNDAAGRDAVAAMLWQPLAHALPDMERRDDILMAGRFAEADWVAATGHYAGTFAAPLFGIPPTGGLALLRYGEVYRIAEGRIAEAYIHLDFVDLMRQAGVNPLPRSRGAEGIAPAPLGHDGLLLGATDPAESAASLALVEAMIFGGLRRFDGRTLASMGMERYWTPTMGWYGPCGIGATRGIAGFQAHHQRPFLQAFPDRVGGDHKARFGDGAYVCSTGWPSITATFTGDWLGVAPTGTGITMRVMDVWRRAGDLLAENWVFIDIPHVLAQAGVDVFARSREMASGA
jgi:predicted ester cyclase